MIGQINICDVMKHNEIERFLKRVITGDEKCITNNNWKRKRTWMRDGEPSRTFTHLGLTPNKVMLCVWWGWKITVHHELLPVGQTINSQVYC